MKKLSLAILGAAAIWLCLVSNSMAGPGPGFAVVVGAPVYYPPSPYYYGPGYYGCYGPGFYWHSVWYRGGHHWR